MDPRPGLDTISLGPFFKKMPCTHVCNGPHVRSCHCRPMRDHRAIFIRPYLSTFLHFLVDKKKQDASELN